MADPLEDMYRAYKTSIYNYLLHLTLNRHTAEELTHDTFLKIFKSFRKFRGESSLKTWLYTIARNTYLNDSRKKSNQMEEQTDLTSVEFAEPKDPYAESNEKQWIQYILGRIPEQGRTLILLRDQQGLSYKEIARIMDITEGRVKIGLHRARKKFKEYYFEGSQER